MPRYKDNTPIPEEMADQMKEHAQELENLMTEEPTEVVIEDPVEVKAPEEIPTPAPQPIIQRTPEYGRPVKRYSKEFVRMMPKNNTAHYHAKKAGRRGK